MKLSKHLLTAAVVAAVMSGSAFAQTTSGASEAPATSKQAVKAQNRATAKTVRKALTAAKGLRSDNIVVLVKGGVITLAGTVPDGSQVQIATDAATGVAGNVPVSNKLSIKEQGGS
jgi:hyperosmotically inducible protein